jgi:hypothetical protein
MKHLRSSRLRFGYHGPWLNLRTIATWPLQPPHSVVPTPGTPADRV